MALFYLIPWHPELWTILCDQKAENIICEETEAGSHFRVPFFFFSVLLATLNNMSYRGGLAEANPLPSSSLNCPCEHPSSSRQTDFSRLFLLELSLSLTESVKNDHKKMDLWRADIQFEEGRRW